jgi:hypothetical protein
LDITANPAYSGMDTNGGDCFTDVSLIRLDDSLMDASGHGYGTQCLADYFQCLPGCQPALWSGAAALPRRCSPRHQLFEIVALFSQIVLNYIFWQIYGTAIVNIFMKTID